MAALPKYVLICLVVLAVAVWTAPVTAANEDASLFQEALAPYGQWLQHNHYGLVWRPSQVSRSWQPYTNGRWVLTQDGYVFETDEPWGWATYHYGNWQNTPEYGWIWIPGRTWYPHTVTWRANDEHVGWAPVPPPDVANADMSWPDGYASAPSYGSSGYPAASLPASAWIFTRARDFLYGWGEPYSSRYSYYNAGLLAAPQYVPVIYERTVYIYNYVTPAYAPRACYNWGPPVTYVTKVTNINQRDFHQRYQRHRLHHCHNALPPKHVLDRHPAWRQLVPAVARDGQRPGRWWTPAQTRNMTLNRPDALPLPPSLSRPATPRSGQPGDPVPTPPAVAAPPPTPAPGSRPGEAYAVKPVAKPPLDAGRMSSRPERLQPGQRPSEGTATPGRVTAPPPSAPPLAATVPPSGSTPQGSDPGTAPPRRPQPQILRPQPTPAPNGTTVSGTPAQPPAVVKPPADRQGWQQEQVRRQQQEQEARQQVVRRQQQEEQQRQNLIQRQQQEQHRQAELLRQQQEAQRRQAELLRQQQAQQQRQAEMIRQQQLQQQRQAEMIRQQQEQQRRQAEMQQQKRVQSTAAGQPQRKRVD